MLPGFVAKSVDGSHSIMVDTENAIQSGLLRADHTQVLYRVCAQARQVCQNCRSVLECTHYVYGLNDRFASNGTVFTAPRMFEHVYRHDCANPQCVLTAPMED